MPNHLSSAHVVGLSPSAQSEGQLIGILFQIRDDYVQAHNLVFGNPITRVLRFVRVLRAPRLNEVAASVEVQLRMLDAASSGLAGLPLSRLRLKGAVEYFESLRRAMSALHVLLKGSSARNVLPPASSATRKEYQIASEAFGTVGDRLRRQDVLKSEDRTRVSPEPAGLTESAAAAPMGALRPTHSTIPAGKRYFTKSIETPTDLNEAVFALATLGSEDGSNMLLSMSGVPQSDFDRLQMEALYLSLFTVRLAFTHATFKGSRLHTEGLARFDDTVTSYFAPDREALSTYEARVGAYSLVFGPDTVLATALGQEYSRICGSESKITFAMGASLVDVMIKGVEEAVAAFRNAQTLQITADPRISQTGVIDQGMRPAAADERGSRNSSASLDDNAVGKTIVALAYLLDVKDPTVINTMVKAVPALTPSEARWELFCLRAFAGRTAILSGCTDGGRREQVTKGFYEAVWATIPFAGWSEHAGQLLPRIESYIYAFSTLRTSAQHQNFGKAVLVGSELMRCCLTSEGALGDTGSIAFLTTFESAARVIEESKVA